MKDSSNEHVTIRRVFSTMCVCLPEKVGIHNLNSFARATELIHDLTSSGLHDNILSTRIHFQSGLHTTRSCFEIYFF